jgi:hypothetical protein
MLSGGEIMDFRGQRNTPRAPDQGSSQRLSLVTIFNALKQRSHQQRAILDFISKLHKSDILPMPLRDSFSSKLSRLDKPL